MDPLCTIRPAREADKGALCALFSQVFGESATGLDLFFSALWSPRDTIVAQVSGAVRGMFFLLPASLRCGDSRVPSLYGYALAVHPSCRGRGVAGRILRYLDETVPRRGIGAVVLRPATPPLYGFYRRFGYEEAFYSRVLPLTPLAGVENIRMREVPLAELPLGREHYFPTADPLFCWERPMLRYVDRYLALYGGKTVWVEAGSCSGYVSYYQTGDEIEVLEASSEDAARLLCAALGARGGRLRLAADASDRGEVQPQAMCKWYIPHEGGRNGYFAFGLD